MPLRSSVRRCFVLNCDSVHSSVQKDTTVFRFPRVGPAWKEWLRLSGDAELLEYPLEALMASFRMCVKHFKPTDLAGKAGKRVKPGAIPCIFPPQHQPIAEDTFQKWLEEHTDAQVGAILSALAVYQAPGKVAAPRKKRVRGTSIDDSSNREVEGSHSELPKLEAGRELTGKATPSLPLVGEFSGCPQSPCTAPLQQDNQDEPTSSRTQLDRPPSADKENVPVEPSPEQTLPLSQASGERQWEFTYLLSTSGNKLLAVPCWAVDLSSSHKNEEDVCVEMGV